MARQPMVTRTILTTTVKALCVDINSKSTCEQEFILPRNYKDDSAIMKALAKVDTGALKVVHVIASEVNETLYGMTEDVFIANAKVLPPRTANAEA